MAKKAPAKPAAKKAPAKRKSKAPVVSPLKSSSLWRRLMLVGAVVAGLAVSFGGGVWSAGGINIGPKPIVRNDVLQQSYDADRVTQVEVLRDLAKQPFNGSTADGKIAAQDWFNVQRFRNRPKDYEPYTEAVAEAIDANSEEVLAATLEGK